MTDNDRPSLRNYFAAHALQGLLAHPDQQPPEVIVDCAFKYADAMVARTQESIDFERDRQAARDSVDRRIAALDAERDPLFTDSCPPPPPVPPEFAR